MSDAQSLARELGERGYTCATTQAVDGASCIIREGPNGTFEPPAQVHFRNPGHHDGGGVGWQDAGGQTQREPRDISDTALAEAVIASIELFNPA